MKKILSLILLLPLIASAQTTRWLGYPSEKIMTRNLNLGSDSLGWGNIRITGDSLQYKNSNNTWVYVGQSGGGTVYASNGVRMDGDTVKLGLKVSPPFTEGLITESMYLLGGDVGGGASYGLVIEPSRSEISLSGGLVSNSNASYLLANEDDFYLRKTQPDGEVELNFQEDELKVISNVAGFKGLTYNIDYSTSFNSNDRAVPDVGWVKSYVTIDTNVVSNAGTLSLSTKGYYSFNGTTTTWTLPAVAASTSTRYVIANMGNGNITINAATNTIWEAGTTMSSTTIAAGETTIIYSNGIYWTIYN